TPRALNVPMTYLVTFSCYASRLHGDPRGSVDRNHNQVGGPMRGESRPLLRYEQDHLTHRPYLMDESRRQVVLAPMIDTCAFRGWQLFAVHVRENHVHVVLDAESPFDRIAVDLKAYASRALNRAGIDDCGIKRWSRKASVRTLRTPEARELAIRYVAEKQ